MKTMDLIQMLKKIFISLVFLVNIVYAKDIKPAFVYKASGGVTSIVYNSGKLYVSTQAGAVNIFDLKQKKLIKSIKLPKIKDFMGDDIEAKIYNTDVSDDDILFVAQHESGFRELYIYKHNKLKKLLSADDHIYISKAMFIDKDNILFCSLANEMFLYNIVDKKIKWKIDVKAPDAEFNSTFADFALNEDKSLAVVADESGDLKLVDIKKAKVIKILAGQNLDKVFKVDFKNNKIITAGQDRRCVVYNLSNNNHYYFETQFLIYGAGLSKSGKFGAYSSDENNNVTVFNTNTKQKLYKLTNNLMTLTSICFINDKEVFIGTDSNKFNYYKLGE